MNYIRFLYQVRRVKPKDFSLLFWCIYYKIRQCEIGLVIGISNFCEEDGPFWHLETCVILKSYVGIVHPRIETVGKAQYLTQGLFNIEFTFSMGQCMNFGSYHISGQ